MLTRIPQSKNNHTLTTDKNEKIWTNEICKPVSTIDAFIDIKILSVMRQLDERFPDVEYGIYVKGVIEEGQLIISSEFKIPKQTVSGAMIDFSHESDTEWNGVIHKHPSGCNNFSAQDEKFINSNHLFSILYVDGSFKKGIINLDVDIIKSRVRLNLNVHVLYPNVDINNDDINNITRQVIVVQPQTPTITRIQGSGGGPNILNIPPEATDGGTDDSYIDGYLKFLLGDDRPIQGRDI